MMIDNDDDEAKCTLTMNVLKQIAQNATHVTKETSTVTEIIPWVPEPQNLNERKLVRGKERRKN